MFEDADYEALQKAASARGLTVAEWVRQALVAARRRESSGNVDRKLDVIRAAVRHTGPTGQIDRLGAEIERGYLSGVAPGSTSTGGY